MNLDDLKQIWKTEMATNTALPNFEQMQNKVEKYDRQAKWGVVAEFCIFIAIVGFCIFLLVTQEFESQLLQIMVASMIPVTVSFGVIQLWSQYSSIENDWTLMSRISQQIEKRNKEMKILQNMTYWYLIPIYLLVIFSSYYGYFQRTGIYSPETWIWLYWIGCSAFFTGIHLYYRHRIKTKVKPVLNHLHRIQQQLMD